MGKSRASKKRAKDVGNDVNADVAMAAAVRKVREILSDHSEQEIREMLIECNMKHNFAINRLLSQQELRNQQGTSTQLPDSSTTPAPNQSAITNGETRSEPISSTEAVPTLHVPSSSDVTNGETRTVSISSSEAVPPMSSESSSSAITNGETGSVPTSSNPSLSLPSSSAITNGETRSVPISSNVAAPPLSVSSSRALTKVKPKRQDTMMISAYGPTMAEVLRSIHVPSKQNVTKAPVKADSPLLHQKPDATNPISNSFTQSNAARDPQPSDFPMDTRQSIATASSLGPRPPPTFMAEAFGTYPHNNQQGMNWGQYGNMINSPYLRRPAQIRPPPAPIQKRGGSNRNSNALAHHVNILNSPHSWLKQDDASLYQSMDSVFAQYRNNTLPLSATSTVPSSHGSVYGSANSRLEYEDVSRYHLPSNSSGASVGPSSNVNGSNSRLGYGDYLPSVPHQGRSPFVWRVQGEDSCRSIPPYNQQERAAYFERLRAHLLDQENNNTSAPSDQTQQRPRDK